MTTFRRFGEGILNIFKTSERIVDYWYKYSFYLSSLRRFLRRFVRFVHGERKSDPKRRCKTESYKFAKSMIFKNPATLEVYCLADVPLSCSSQKAPVLPESKRPTRPPTTAMGQELSSMACNCCNDRGQARMHVVEPGCVSPCCPRT